MSEKISLDSSGLTYISSLCLKLSNFATGICFMCVKDYGVREIDK